MRYKVVFAMNYEIEAETKEEALEEAEELFQEDTGIFDNDLFGCNIDEAE